MKPDNTNTPHVASDSEPPASKRTEVEPWWRRTRNQVLAGVGTVVVGVAVAVIANLVSARLPTPVSARPTSTSVTPVVTPSPGTRGNGWSLTPVVLANDYLTVTASMQPGAFCPGTGWVFRQPPTQLAPSASNSPALNSWAVHNGGIPQSGNYITFTVQARNGHTVIILDFGIKILRRAVPVGTATKFLGSCGGGLTPSFFDVNLDKPGLQVTPVSGMDAVGNPVPPVPLPHEVTESSPEQWRFQILTTNCDCTFVPYFTWSSDGNLGTFSVPDGSQPWRVTAVTRGMSRSVIYP